MEQCSICLFILLIAYAYKVNGWSTMALLMPTGLVLMSDQSFEICLRKWPWRLNPMSMILLSWYFDLIVQTRSGHSKDIQLSHISMCVLNVSLLSTQHYSYYSIVNLVINKQSSCIYHFQNMSKNLSHFKNNYGHRQLTPKSFCIKRINFLVLLVTQLLHK